ncbi:helix-turn-helix transcriptional regulator [Clostridium rectalis]|uniref:helix-turn-helix transcriptional regulator n=1 Tax=Clostridium rectalis TaxID=2040295 RepID=UPI000F639BD0|nr:helix-turn-helix domain-containing protein [Clostridium rectalis]
MEFLTKKEIAELLKCSEKTIDRLRKEGLPSYNLSENKGKVLFLKDEVIKWIMNNKKE